MKPDNEEELSRYKKYKESYIKYRKNNVKRIPLDVSIEKYEEIKAEADRLNEPVNHYIKKAIDDRMRTKH